MKTKNFRLCSITNCINTNVRFCVITEFAYEKYYKNKMLQAYPYIKIEKQLCYLHYYKLVENVNYNQ